MFADILGKRGKDAEKEKETVLLCRRNLMILETLTFLILFE